jgi:hypothetical protein
MEDSARPIRASLVAAARNALDVGATSHVRALYLALVSSEVVGSDSGNMVKLQPKVHGRITTAWERAYALVVMFLRNYEMEHTEATLETEMQSDRPDDANLGLDDFRDIFRFAVSKPFRSRVQEFSARRQKKSGQSHSPRVRGKRGGSARQTPVHKRTAAKQKTTPVAIPASERKPTIRTKPPVTITLGVKSIRPDFSDSDIDSDVIVTEIIPARRK